MGKDKASKVTECPCCGREVKGKAKKRAARWSVQLKHTEVLLERLGSVVERRITALQEADARDPEGAQELRRLVEKHVAVESEDRPKSGWQEIPPEEVLKDAPQGARTFKWNAATPADAKREKALREAQKAKQEMERREKNRVYARKYYQQHKDRIDRRQRDRKARARAGAKTNAARQQVKSAREAGKQGGGGNGVH